MSAGGSELRRRIRSIQNTAQMTRAMQMVAASKMRRAQQAALNVRPFAQALYRIQRHAIRSAQDFAHPLLDTRAVRRRAVILVAGDKGLCGALNANVFRLATEFEVETTGFIAAGRKAAQFVTQTRRRLLAEFPYGDAPRFAEARAMAAMARDLFLKRQVDEVSIVATRFVNTLTQSPMVMPWLPIGDLGRLQLPGLEVDAPARPGACLFEPSPEAMLSDFLPRYLNISLYIVLLNAKASEQSARMVSMKNATDNAEQLIRELTLTYNTLRQGAITRELLEIAGGQVR